ncbi:hypothetical protein [Paracoccus zhejiangensis]|uniref:hypothetical protein n=1 Tax=Paracoccus zhejiangensis TaxID=1077935 RepID=UPI001300108B|nr:hypothetical protein [Paracoccus zhejiangensis]
MIYYDEFGTWEASFGDRMRDLVGQPTIDGLIASDFRYVEDAGDFISKSTNIETISTAIGEWLEENEFCIFHGTRLLPEEKRSVVRDGLRPLAATDREARLKEIFSSHPSWVSVEGNLASVIEDVGPGEQQGGREGQVHFSLSRAGLVDGFNHYLTHGSEFDQCVARRLFPDGTGLQLLEARTDPVLVHVRIEGIELIKGAHPYFSYREIVEMGEIPGLGSTFLNTWAFKVAKPSFDIATLKTDCCMMQRHPTSPERILRTEALDHLLLK